MRIIFVTLTQNFYCCRERRRTNTRNSSHKPPKLVLLSWGPKLHQNSGKFLSFFPRFSPMYDLEFRYAFQNWDDLWEFQVKFLFLENSFFSYHISESFISQIYFTICDKRNMSTTDHSTKLKLPRKFNHPMGFYRSWCNVYKYIPSSSSLCLWFGDLCHKRRQ